MLVRWALPLLLLAACSSTPEQRSVLVAKTRNTDSQHARYSIAGRERIRTDPDPDTELARLIAEGRFKPQRSDPAPLSPLTASTYSLRARNARLQTVGNEESSVEIYIFSMGQADSMLVVGPVPKRRTMLIDVGETNWNTRKGCLHVRERVKDITGQYRVDYLVLTHYHQDHAGAPAGDIDGKKSSEGGGLFCLLSSKPDFFSVGTFIDSGAPSQRYLPAATPSLVGIEDNVDGWIASGTLGSREIARHGREQIMLGGGVNVDIVVTNGQVSKAAPEVHATVEGQHPGTYSGDSAASPNDFSVGMEISIGEFNLFTAGDLTGAPENDQDADFVETPHRQIYTNIEGPLAELWKRQQRPSQVEVYRASHHGSGNSTTEQLIDLLRPQLVIYSVGGKYGHPSDSVLIKAQRIGADQLITTRADRAEGTIPEVYSNGWDNPAGEIRIVVPVGGSEYTVLTDTQAFTYPLRSRQN